MVNQLKAQLDDSQIIISQSTVIVPKTEITTIPISYIDLSKEDLISHLQNKDKQIEESTTKIQELQANVLDLQENLKEKDSVIDARTKAITLLSENLSKKGKNTLDMLDETKEQMRNMQEQFVVLETKMKDENAKLQLDLDKKCKEIETLIAANEKLIEEKSCLEYSNIDLQERLNSAITELENSKMELANNELKVQELETTLAEIKGKFIVSLRKYSILTLFCNTFKVSNSLTIFYKTYLFIIVRYFTILIKFHSFISKKSIVIKTLCHRNMM